MNKNLKISALMLSMLSSLPTFATDVTSNAFTYIQGNNDNSGNGEGVLITGNGVHDLGDGSGNNQFGVTSDGKPFAAAAYQSWTGGEGSISTTQSFSGNVDGSGNLISGTNSWANYNQYSGNFESAGSQTGVVNYNNGGYRATGTYAYTDGSGNSYTGIGVDYASDGSGNNLGFRGLNVNQTESTLSGGTSQVNATHLTMANNGATFGNYNNQPIQVHGVNDGTAAYDAVNVRQLNAVKAGVASTVAMANIPQVDQGKKFALGVGMGGYDGKGAIAAGGSIRLSDSAVIKGSVGYGFNSDNQGSATTTYGLGAAYSW